MMVSYTCKVKETKQRLQPNATMSQYTRMVEFNQTQERTERYDESVYMYG